MVASSDVQNGNDHSAGMNLREEVSPVYTRDGPRTMMAAMLFGLSVVFVQQRHKIDATKLRGKGSHFEMHNNHRLYLQSP